MSKIILGINPYHADSSSCLFVNGELKSAVEEERINRVKHWAGLPLESIKFCLSENNLNINDVDTIAINTSPSSNLKIKIIYFLKNYIFGKKKYEIYSRLKKKKSIRNNILDYFSSKKNITFEYYDHHLSHISSAYFASGFDKAMGLSVDGFGDFTSIAWAKCEGKKIEVLERVFFPNSLGIFYEAITQLLEFKNYGDEYKVMGLSSYGNPSYVENLKKLFIDNNLPLLNTKYFNHVRRDFSYKFEGVPKQEKIFNDKISTILNLKISEISEYEKADIAKSCQILFENYLMNLIDKIKKINFSKNFVYAGGCALNSLANKKIIEDKYFNKVFIPYAPGDNGGSIGASLLSAVKNLEMKDLKNLQSPYLGPRFSNEEISKIIKNKNMQKKYKIREIQDKIELFKIASMLLKDSKILGFFNGRMEFGARALGNRSILADASNVNIKQIINQKIKRRENFRPFAPAILEDHKQNWFVTDFFNPYMAAVEGIKNEKKHLIPGVTHVDGTGRVQSVSKKYNKNFYNLINEFYKISNIPILLNTSFNENEPIVFNPLQAINCFERTDMDAIVLENYLIEK